VEPGKVSISALFPYRVTDHWKAGRPGSFYRNCRNSGIVPVGAGLCPGLTLH
jgi:hypothetical protein